MSDQGQTHDDDANTGENTTADQAEAAEYRST